MSETEHSPLGASQAARYMACPGSVALCAPLPPEQSKYAAEGTAAHRICELCLRNGHDPHDFVGRFVEGFEVAPEMADAAQLFVNTVRAVHQKGDTLLIEHRFSLDEFDSELFGTADCVIYKPASRELHVYDYKHGVGVPVSVTDNPQLKFYALGALLSINAPVAKVICGVVQPRCPTLPPVQTWETTPVDLLEFGGELAEAAERTRQPDAPLNPGSHCRFCRARGTCSALRDSALAAAGLDFEDISKGPTPPAEMTPEQLGQALEATEVIKLWLKAVEEHALREARAGRPAAGWKLIAGEGKREWQDADLAMRQALREFDGLTEDQLYERKPLSPSKFETLLGKASAQSFLRAYARKNTGKLKLVRLSDKRPAVDLSALSEFEDIGDGNYDES